MRAVESTTKMVAAVGLAYSQLSTYPKWYLDLSGVCEKDYLQEISSDKSDKSDKKPNINQTYQRN